MRVLFAPEAFAEEAGTGGCARDVALSIHGSD